MITLVFNSTPLIYLTKAKVLSLIEKIYAEKLIPETVFYEVAVKGKKIGAPDAFLIEDLINKKILTVKKPKKTKSVTHFLENPNIHKADAEVLALAEEFDGIAILDDDEARAMADIENIENGGSLYVLFTMLNQKIISKKDVRNAVDKMIKAGWRCSTELYAEIIKVLEKFRKRNRSDEVKRGSRKSCN